MWKFSRIDLTPPHLYNEKECFFPLEMSNTCKNFLNPKIAKKLPSIGTQTQNVQKWILNIIMNFFYFWPLPLGWKISRFFLRLPYKFEIVDVGYVLFLVKISIIAVVSVVWGLSCGVPRFRSYSQGMHSLYSFICDFLQAWVLMFKSKPSSFKSNETPEGKIQF